MESAVDGSYSEIHARDIALSVGKSLVVLEVSQANGIADAYLVHVQARQ